MEGKKDAAAENILVNIIFYYLTLTLSCKSLVIIYLVVPLCKSNLYPCGSPNLHNLQQSIFIIWHNILESWPRDVLVVISVSASY